MAAGKKAVGRRPEAVERQDPAGGGELRRPDRVELEDVGLARPRVEPLHVELMALVGRVGRGPLHDPDVGVLPHESRELAAQDLALGAERAAREGDDHRAAGCRTGAPEDEQGGRRDPERGGGESSSGWNRGVRQKRVERVRVARMHEGTGTPARLPLYMRPRRAAPSYSPGPIGSVFGRFGAIVVASPSVWGNGLMQVGCSNPSMVPSV